MRRIFLALILVSSAFSSTTTEEIGLITSSPDQLTSLNEDSNYLIGGCVHPLSGQLLMSSVDLVAKGAQELSLFRVFIPVAFAPPGPVHSEMQSYYDERSFLAALQKSHRGWIFMPHLQLERNSSEIKVPDKNGAIYSFIKGKLTQTSGLSNSLGDIPSGKFDARNIQIIDREDSVTVILPEGTKRDYNLYKNEIYYLSRETLPNGKVLKYNYLDNQLIIQSFDPEERHLYAYMTIDTASYKNELRVFDKLKKATCGEYKHDAETEISYTISGVTYTAVSSAKTNTGQSATYGYESTNRSRTLKKKCGNYNYQFSFTPNLITSSTPNYRNEIIAYDNFLPNTHSGRFRSVRVEYEGSPARIKRVYLPTGERDEFIPVYTLDIQNGTSTVTQRDGYKTIYSFSTQMLPTSIKWMAPNGKVIKVKTVTWDGSNRLSSIEWTDGENNTFWKRSFEDYDSFNNPQKEKFSGDLTGTGAIDTYAINRVFSKDGMNLLLREEIDDGLVTTIEYVNGTNLIKSKLTSGAGVHIREIYEYDDCNNLKMKIIDDGEARTQRRVTVYTLKQEQPFLHMPEWIEESYVDGLDTVLIRKTKLTYDAYGNVCQEDVHGSDGVPAYSLKRTFDEQGNILSETNPLGYTATCSYYLRGLPNESENFSKRLKTKKEYNAAGRLKKITERGEDVAHTTVYEYNTMGQLEKETDPFDNAITYKEYDSIANQPNRIEFPSIANMDHDLISVVKKAKYDGLGRVIEEVDANRQITKYKYNAYGSPILKIYPNGSSEKFLYYKNGLLHFHTDQEGLLTEYFYDVLGRVTKKQYSLQDKYLAEETFTYDSFHLKSHTDKERFTTTYEHDGAGRKMSENRAGRTIEFTYDNLGRLATETHSRICFQTDYDEMGQLKEKRKTDLSGKVHYKVSYSYDADGNRETMTRYPHNIPAQTNFSYDPFKRLTSITDPMGHTATTSYDESNTSALKQRILTKTLTDANGITTRVTYDALGREVSRKISDLRTEERFYDPAGNLTHIKEGSRITRYTYNSMNLAETLTRAFGSPDARETTYNYTQSGLLKTKQLPNSLVLNYICDPFGHPETVIASDGSLSQHFTYNTNGSLLRCSGGKHTVVRELDPFGNTIAETIDGKWTLFKTYDYLNRPLTLTLPDKTMIRYTYDPVYLKTVERLSATGEVLYSHTYDSYDQNGDLLSEILPLTLGPRSHTYDPNTRLKDLSNSYFSQTLTYDPAGRIKNISSEGSYTYDDLRELTTEPLHAYAYDSRYNRTKKDGDLLKHNHLDEVISVSHDLNGNLIQKGSFALSYDPLNRLIQAESESELLTFTYDPLGRRLTKNTNDTELYLYDGTQEIASFHTNGALKDLCIRGRDQKPIALELQGEILIPICDFRGNIRRLIDPKTQTIVQSLNYTAFGEETTPVEKPFNPWRYSAKRYDLELALSYFGHRYYDACKGRWITTDPVGFLDGLNLYAYVSNDPLSYGDSDGRFAIPLFTWAIGGAAMCPISWGVIAAVGVGYAACWGVQKLIDQGSLRSGTASYSVATGLTGGLAGAMINNSLENNLNFSSTGYSPYREDHGFNYLSRKKEGSVDPSLPANPDELLNRPGWRETSHPEGKKKGHREFENSETGEQLRHDEGRPGMTGHEAHDHYHRPNPNSRGDIDKYLDGQGNPVPKGHEKAHIYPQGKVWW